MRGLFNLTTARDLFAKLRADIDQLRREPTNTYAAFNFFVTAEHMKDWALPGKANKSAREDLENSSVVLQVCSHIANGAKHLIVEAKHHTSVSDTRRRKGSHWPKTYWGKSHWGKHWGAGAALVVHLEGAAAQQLGATISAVELAELVMAFWENRPEVA
jgi:hypothetical protein